MTNVVITYTGNVCSTPMISYAGLMDDVFVPVREQLDPHRIQRLVPEPARHAPILAETLTALYQRRPAGLFDHPDFKRFPNWATMPSAAEKPHLVFKWRPFLEEVPDGNRVAEVFERNDVSPVVLVRRSLAEHAIKVFMTEKIYGRSQQQFVAAGMKKDAYDAYMDDQREMRVEILASDMTAVRRQAQAFLLRTRLMVKYTQRFFPHTATPLVLIAEDIFAPMLDRDRFNRVLASLLGDVRPLAEQAEPDVRKAGLDLSHCANLDVVLADRELADLSDAYQDIVGGLRALRPFEA